MELDDVKHTQTKMDSYNREIRERHLRHFKKR